MDSERSIMKAKFLQIIIGKGANEPCGVGLELEMLGTHGFYMYRCVGIYR